MAIQAKRFYPSSPEATPGRARNAPFTVWRDRTTTPRKVLGFQLPHEISYKVDVWYPNHHPLIYFDL